MENSYIHCIHLFDRSISTYCIYQKKIFGEPHLSVTAAEVSVSARDRAMVVAEGGGGRRSNGVESAWQSRDRGSRERAAE
jgi:hypothetical protein